MDIKNLKEVVIAGCLGFEAYVKAKADGKIDTADIMYLIPFAQAVGPAVADINLVPAEALDLDKAELADLVQSVMVAVPELKDAGQAIQRIEAVMNLLLAAKDCYNAFASQPLNLKLSGLNVDAAAAAVKIAQISAARAAPAAEMKAAVASVDPAAPAPVIQ